MSYLAAISYQSSGTWMVTYLNKLSGRVHSRLDFLVPFIWILKFANKENLQNKVVKTSEKNPKS